MPRQRRNLYVTQKVMQLKITNIMPNPAQPRREFDPEALRELAESIAEYGVLQPLTVRRVEGGYELVAGERRLRAADMAGLHEVPCLLLGVDAKQSSLIALVENLQRRDLDFLEEAQGLQRLIQQYGLSQEEAATKVGKSQSAVANKLRLLKHPPDILNTLRLHNLTERHARALLRLDAPTDRRRALDKIIAGRLNVAQSEKLIDQILAGRAAAVPPPRPPVQKLFVLKDVRLFLNTVGRAVDLMRQSGVEAGLDKQESEREIVLTIKIPKKVS